MFAHPKTLMFAGMMVPLAVSATEPVTVLSPVRAENVVEDTLTARSLSEARKTVAETPGGAAVIDAEEYRSGRVSTLKDALEYSAGVLVQPRFGAEEARLSIRGSGVQRTFHLRGISLLQDGVPFNHADGSGDFQAMEPLAASYIEVFRGANALGRGQATLGGVVNYVSQGAAGPQTAELRLEGGSFDYARGALRASGRAGVRSDYDLTWAYFSQGGFRDHARQETQRASGSFTMLLNEDLESRIYLTLVDSRSQLPGNLTYAELKGSPSQAAPANVAGDYRRDFQLARIAQRTVYRMGDAQLEVGAYAMWKDLFHPIFQVLRVVSRDAGLDVRYVATASGGEKKDKLILGLSLSRGVADDDRFQNINGSAGARTGESEQIAANANVYVENHLYVTPFTALIAGGQWSVASRRVKDFYYGDGADNSVDKDYRRFSPRLGVLHEVTPTIQIFVNASGSYEPPTFGELSGGPAVTPVEAQRGMTFEVGSRGELGGAGWDFAYYRSRLRGELLSLNSASGMPLGTVNAERTVHQGIEASLRWRFTGGFEWRQAVLWNDFRFDQDPVYGNRRLGGIPVYWYRSEMLHRSSDGFYFGPNVEWVPRRYAVDHANTLYADAYTIWGIKLGRRVSRGVSWFVEGRNLTDRKYAATTGVIANAGGADSRQFLPGDGRAWYAGMQWDL